MQIQKQVQLAPYTTFGIGGPAEFFVSVQSIRELEEALYLAQSKDLPIFILGGGSNILVSDVGIRGLVIKIDSRGIEILEESSEVVKIKVAAGEPWDGVVKYVVDNGWWGIENLSHIPGNSGALAVQNVGAYGQEASQVVESVEVLDTRGILVSHKDSPCVTIGNSDCKFTYRSSIFNTTKKGKYVILSVTLKLSKNPKPNIKYGDVAKYFTEKKNDKPSLIDIRKAITEIRDRKFPYPENAVNGNSGSFFKAHTINEADYATLVKKVHDTFSGEAGETLQGMQSYLKVAQGVKVPYGYLIELCGFKGQSMGNVTVCQTHAGVLVNATGKALAKDVLEAFKTVRQTVYQKTGMTLLNEPELVGFVPEELAYYFQVE